MSYYANNAYLNTAPLNAYRLGIIVDIKLPAHIHLQPGIFYSKEGTNIAEGGSIAPNYLRIPFSIIYRVALQKAGHIYFGLGPVIGYCLGGSVDAGKAGGSSTINVGNDEQSTIKPVDIGMGINAGYKIPQGLFIRAAYIIGLSNLSPNSDNTLKNTSFVISIGCMFNKLR